MPRKIQVLIDTSTLRSLGPRGLLARILTEVVRAGKVAVHVPWIVERELTTQLAGMLSPLSKDHFRASEWMPSGVNSGLTSTLKQVNETLKKSDILISSGVDQWLTTIKAIREKPRADAAAAVFENYFNGSAPFKVRKQRADIPDAFIYESVKSLAARYKSPVHVVSGDDKLRNSCAQIAGVIAHANLNSFFAHPSLVKSVSAAKIVTFCRDHAEDLIELMQPLIGEAVLDAEVESHNLPSDNNEAQVTGFGEAQAIKLDLNEITPISKDVVIVPYCCTVVDNLVDLFIYKGDYYSLSDKERSRFGVVDADWNDHYVEAQTELDLEVQGTATVQIQSLPDGKLEFGDVEVSDFDSITVCEF